jgi:hypothetical protein
MVGVPVEAGQLRADDDPDYYAFLQEHGLHLRRGSMVGVPVEASQLRADDDPARYAFLQEHGALPSRCPPTIGI